MTKWLPKKEEEIGKIKVDETTDIIVRKVVDDDDKTNIDIRIFTRAKNFSGFSSKGIYLDINRLDELINILKSGKK